MSRHLDPRGKQALYDAPVQAAPDQLAAGADRRGRTAIYSSGPRRPGTVVVECSGCQVRTRTTLVELGLRFVPFTAWLPGLQHGHFMRCPACGRYRWCSIGWTD